MSIITFYSYKGGVGRTMALANIAVLLAEKGHRVLVVDWDLEAPGIERYFAELRIESDAAGLLPMLTEVSNGERPDYKQYTWQVRAPKAKLAFTLLHAGRENDPTYYKTLERFEWSKFFASGGGNYLEDLRARWLSDFEFVLIDSRTGLSDAGGVCTIQLPDIVVAMFTPAHQSLHGVRDVMRLAQTARHRLAYDRPALSVVPVPCRVEKKLASYTDWREKFVTQTTEFFAEWLPRDWDRAEVLDRLAIDHEPGVSHGEQLVVLAGGHEKATIGAAYDRIATVLASDLADLSPIAKALPANAHPRARLETAADISRAGLIATPIDYEFDVFISYGRTEMVTRWLRDSFVPKLKDALEVEMGAPPRLFMDSAEIEPGERWVETQREALARSKMMLAVWTPSYFRSRSCMAEFQTFSLRSSDPLKPRFVSILFSGTTAQFPEYANRHQWWDFSRYTFLGKAFAETTDYRDFQRLVREFARVLVDRLRETPPLNPDWTVVEPGPEEPIFPGGVQQVTFEFHRFGEAARLLTPDRRYIRTSGWDSLAKEVSPTLDHRRIQRSLNILRYKIASESEERDAQASLAAEAARFLDGVTPPAAGLLQVDLVTNAAELWAFPFEACFAQFEGWLEDVDRGVVITRRVRGDFSKETPPWPVVPRVLFLHAPVAKDLTQAFIDEHVAALTRALTPWSRGRDVIGSELLAVSEVRSLNDVTRFRSAFRPTYVHLLAHGAPAPPDPYLPEDIVWGLRLGDVGQSGVPPPNVAEAFQPQDGLPLVVTVVACGSFNEANPIFSTHSVVQELHRCGVPFVIGSQLPLTRLGSIALTGTFYERLLRGEDVRVALHAARIALRRNPNADHDWLSLVGYVKLPPEGYAAYLEEVGLRVELGLLDAAQALADRLAEKAEPLADFLPAEEMLEASLRSLNVRRLNLVHSKVLLEEGSGIEANAYKQLAELLFVRGLHHKDLRDADWKRSTEALVKAFKAYRAAYDSDPHNYWLGMQQLTLDVVLTGAVSRPTDWPIVVRSAEIARDLTIQTGKEEYWPYVTLTESALLASRAGGVGALDKAKTTAALLVASSRKAGKEFPIQSTRRQISRYVHWWTKDHGFFPNGKDLSNDARELLTVLV